MLYTLHVFDRTGKELYYHEWSRPYAALKRDQEKKLMFGLLFSLADFVKKMSPNQERERGLRNYRTKQYTMHVLHTATGLRFVLASSHDAGDLHPLLQYLYKDIYVPFVVKNPMYELGSEITCARFVGEVARLPSRDVRRVTSS